MRDKSSMPVWPGWETVRVIGKGSFGAVYEIQREFYGDIEKAAMKVMVIPQDESEIEDLRAEGLDNVSISTTYDDQLRNIVQEYSLMRKMNGTSNVVNCDDVIVEELDDGVSKMIKIKMELLTCMNRVEFTMSPEELALTLGREICIALELCESRNIIHRDIKPNNIFVSDNGIFKLGDFGVSRTMERTSRGTKTGTPDYMAPEVYRGEHYNNSVDLYSLGIVLYWILNEKRTPFLPLPPAVPLMSDRENARLRRLSGEAIPAPQNGSRELVRIVLKACAYRPEDRYHQAKDLRADLERLAALEGIEAQWTAQNVLGEEDDDRTVMDTATVAMAPNNRNAFETAITSNPVNSTVVAEKIEDYEQTVLSGVQVEEKAHIAMTDNTAEQGKKKRKKKKTIAVVTWICIALVVGIASTVFVLKSMGPRKIMVPTVNTEGEITNAMRELSISPKDKSLIFTSVVITDDLMKAICKQKELRYISFTSCVFNVDMDEYQLPEGIYSITIDSCSGIKDFYFIHNLASLSKVCLVNSNVNNTLEFPDNDLIEWVELSNNPEFSDLECIPVEKLTTLYIDGTSVKNLNVLAGAKKLRDLYAQGSKVKTIEALMGLSTLEKLNLSYCSLEKMYSSCMSTGMMGLSLIGCGLTDKDMKVFDYLTRLEVLLIGENNISEARCLEQSISTLKILDVTGDILSESTLGYIAQAANLKELYISGIELGSLDICQQMDNLQILVAENCELESINALGGKSDLKVLDLANNKLSSKSLVIFNLETTKWENIDVCLANNDIKSIDSLPAGSYRFLILNGNPVDWATLPVPDKMTGTILAGDYAEGMEMSILASEKSFNMLFVTGIPGNKWEDMKTVKPAVYPTTVVQVNDLLLNHLFDYIYWIEQDRTYR